MDVVQRYKKKEIPKPVTSTYRKRYVRRTASGSRSVGSGSDRHIEFLDLISSVGATSLLSQLLYIKRFTGITDILRGNELPTHVLLKTELIWSRST